MTTTMAYLKHVAMAKGSPSNFRTLQVEIGNYIWNYMELYEILWNFMKCYRTLWNFMDLSLRGCSG